MQAAEGNARVEHRLHLFEEVLRALGGAKDADEVVDVVRHLVPALGDLAVLVVGEEGAGSEQLIVAHARPEREPEIRALVEQTLEPLRRLASGASQAGHTFRWLPEANPVAVRNATWGDPRIRDLVQELGIRSLIVAGVQNGERAYGALAVARTDSAEPYVEPELATAQVIARRLALALETARLQAAVRRHSHLEEALRKWTRVFDVAGWGAAIVDRAERRIDVVNPAFARLHGYDRPEDLTGRPFADLLPGERAGELAEWDRDPGERGRSYETVHRRANGLAFPALVSVTLLAADEPPASFVVTVQDLTELKRAEDRLRRAQRMEAVGRLAGGVAHEVNNMMTIILGFSDLLGQAPELPGSLQGDVEEIRRAATRAGKITQQLLAFSRQQVLQPTDLRLNTIVEELVPVLRLLLPANIRIDTGLSPLGGIVRADRAQLEQVLINLAFNARDAMPQGGTIRIITEIRYLSEEAGERLIGVPFPPGRYALVTVIDTGHGMDEATVGQVFEPFFTTKPLGLGTGLGLATVYGIVKQSGGYVWVESTPGEGTTVTVGLPLVEHEIAAEPPPEGEPQVETQGGGTVLVVEDEDGVRQLAGRVLGARGYQVLEARNGQEALVALDQVEGGVDLVLTDVVVPDLSVGEFARRVHEAHEDVRILYMSGYPRDDVVQREMIGADQPFLQKPFTGEELAQGVSRVLRGEDPVVEG
ncbi:MAG TPA: ATP-binding protein [Gemmatimonadales bacterium]